MPSRQLSIAAIGCLYMLRFLGLVEAAEAAPQPGAPRVTAVVVDAAPVIDGKLDEACWSQAARLEGFFVPQASRAVPEETVGRICVDAQTLYIGVDCKDRTPQDLRATETRRNGDIEQDDYVVLLLDPSHQHRDTYAFHVTANGTQAETIPGGSATKIEWRGDWKGAAARTSDGYTVEMAIPFSVLRHPAGQSTFGVSLWRYFAQEGVEAVYPATGGTAYNDTLAMDLVDLHLPQARPRPILMPYQTLETRGETTGGESYRTGLDLQYQLANGLAALASVRPDFTQIEQQVEPISFSYTERRLGDARPFFSTGQTGYFPRDLLYTRRIEDFDVGLKLFGNLGGTRYGLLDAVRFGEENSLAASWLHSASPEFRYGGSLVSHQANGAPSNLVSSLEAGRTWRFAEGQTDVWASAAQSLGEGANGLTFSSGGHTSRGSGQLWYDWMLRYCSPDFRPALGLWTDQNSVGAQFATGLRTRHATGDLDSTAWSAGVYHYPFLDGSGILFSWLSASHSWEWRNGRSLDLGAGYGQEYRQDSRDLSVGYGWNGKDLYRRGELFVLQGVRADGPYHYYSVSQGFRPGAQLSLRVALEYSGLRDPAPEPYHAYQGVLTASYDLTKERSLAARIIARDTGTIIYAVYRQVVRRGLDAYLVLGDPDPAKTGFTRRLALKLVRAF